MARVPDLGSDFSQKLLQDLRRRRERLGFESSSAAAASAQQQRTANAAAPRDSSSNSRRPLRSQKPQQGAPRGRRPEAAATHRSQHQQGSNAIVSAGKPRRRAAPAADAHAIVLFQGGGRGGGGGGGGGDKPKPPVANAVDVQMALALALSNSGKLQNIELVARNGAVFFREPDRAQAHRRHRRDGGYLMPPGTQAHVGDVAIGVQKLNDILMAYSSGAGAGAGTRDLSRRSSVDHAGKKLFRGAMDLEESLNMLVMLQEASDYMEGSGNGKVLLLKGKENRKSSATRSPGSARIVEIVDEDAEAEEAKNVKSTSNASMQMVAHNRSQCHGPNSSSVWQFSTVSSNSKNNASEGGKHGSEVRVPNVIAKLMGLENLPSSAKAVAAAGPKVTEKFVKSDAVPRKEFRANAMDRKLPIRIIASEKVSQHKILLGGKWKTGLTKCEESEISTALSNSSSHPVTDKQVRLTMRQVLGKMVGTERGADERQGVNERIIEEIKLQKSVSVGCRSDAGKKMDFLKRFRKNSDNRPVIEDKHTTQEKSTTVGKKQATSMKPLLGRDNETKSRRIREKINKENLATTEAKAAGKNGKTDQMKRQAHSKLIDKESVAKKAQNYREMQSGTPSQNIEDKRSLKSEAARMKKKPAHNIVIQREIGNHTEVNDISSSKSSGTTHGDGAFSEHFATLVKDSSSTGLASSDQSVMKITEEINNPAIAVVHASDDTKVLDQSAIAEINGGSINHTASETTQILETFTGEEPQQQEQMMVKEKPVDGLDDTTTSSNPTDLQDHKMHVVSCDSFTANQLLLMKMLLKDQYLLQTAKAIVRVQAPVNFVDATASNWSGKGNDILSDVVREVIRRKGKRTEAMVEVNMMRTANVKLRYLDDLIRELDDEIESLNIFKKPHQQSGDGTAETLQMILHRDIQNNHPDANSTWDFGWNHISDLPIEKNEVVKDLEKNILGGIITDVARDLIGVSVRHGCCPCEA